MQLVGTRFGDLEVSAAKVIVFARGLIGFAETRQYVLLEPRAGSRVAWLQSLDVPELAFPVVDGASFGPGYPDPAPSELARDAGLGFEDLATLVVVAANRRQGLVANMLAPVVIDLKGRAGAQVVLDPRRYAAAAPVAEAAVQGAGR